MDKIRLRLAPSPTGFLHIGNLRTALFGYLLAKSMGGKFILRIEDTDQKREVEGAADSLIEVLDWAGIRFDEGFHVGGDYGPYIQSQRLEIYHKLADELLAKGGAYRCFCSEDRLKTLREQQAANKQAPRYDRLCRQLSPEEVKTKVGAGESFVIRQALPLEGEITVHDELRGDINWQAKDLDDHVLIKSNGVPTYQFASVIDDHLMKITHVTRGDEWLPSFPKNILLYQAFGWEIPKFIHLPLILNKTGGKLSKRQGDVFVEQYRDKGYLPEALINFCALLGWHPKSNVKDELRNTKLRESEKEIFNTNAKDELRNTKEKETEIFSLAELEKIFSIDGLGTSPAVFDEDKLDYLNGYYIRQKTDEDLLSHLKRFWQTEQGGDEFLLKIIPTVKERLKRLDEISELTGFYFNEPEFEKGLLLWKSLTAEQVKNNLAELVAKLETVPEADWAADKLEENVIAWLKENGKKNGDYLWPMRVALTGQKASPGPFEVAGVLGKEGSLERLKEAQNKS